MTTKEKDTRVANLVRAPKTDSVVVHVMETTMLAKIRRGIFVKASLMLSKQIPRIRRNKGSEQRRGRGTEAS